MTLITAFLFFAFSTIGLGMLYLSQIYLKLGSYKKNAIVLEYASENGIKEAYNQLTQLIREAPSPLILSPEKAAELNADAKAKGIKTAEELLGKTLPLTCEDTWENLSWSAQAGFFVKHIEESEDYCHEFFDVLIQSEGYLTNFKQKRTSSLLASLEVWTGHIPLPAIPFLIDKTLSPEQKESFIEDNNIEISKSSATIPPAGISFSPEELLPADATPLVKKALKVNIFQPQELSQSLLREALGLEPSNDPVPAGVYLIQDNLGLGGIFVEGDLDEMVLAIEHDFQVISFRSENGQWLLKFNPSDFETIFISPEGTQYFDLVPRGIIVVNGEIRSLGGGVVDTTGQVTMIKDNEIPCILRGVNLTIISSEKTTLLSHLIHQGVKWEDGIPFVKDGNSQLHIFATGQDVQGNSTENGEIVIASDSPDDMKIQASLTSSKKGISLEGENKTINLFGSIQASDYNSNGNELKITFDDGYFPDETHLENTPKSAKPILYVASYGAVEWRENK
ncbi:hypothetical protein ACFLT2_09620 [Acidobacteriota bacterium]